MKGSIHTEIIERAGGVNVADDGGATRGLVQASPEQHIVADPEIVTWDRNFFDRVWDDPLWAGIEEVREGRSICRRRRRSAGLTGRRRSTGGWA